MIEQLTNADVFEKVVVHLCTQRRKAAGAGGCQYLTNDGLCCAIGVFIPPELYNPELEGHSVASREFQSIIDQIGLKGAAIDLLTGLQLIHDGFSPSSWTKKFRAFYKEHCDDFGLKWTDACEKACNDFDYRR